MAEQDADFAQEEAAMEEEEDLPTPQFCGSLPKHSAF